MELYFLGAENSTYLRKLRKLKVTHVAISYLEWQRRYASDDIHHHITDDLHVVITAGVSRKNDSFDFVTFAKDYIEFCEKNAHQVDFIYDMDAPHCPVNIRKEVRNALALLPNSVIFPIGHEDLVVLAKQHDKIGINANVSKSAPAAELRRIHAQLFGSNVTNATTLRTARFQVTTTQMWLNSRRFGELWIFARNKMRTYSADELKKAVRSHERDIIALGVDPAKCLENNIDALTACAVRSFQALVTSITNRPRDRRAGEIAATTPESLEDEVFDNQAPGPDNSMGNGALPVLQRITTMLPGLAVKDQDGVAIVARTHIALRSCDSCSLADICPGYEHEAQCKFDVPIEIKNDAQWEAASAAILEMQFDRVAFARFGEELSGDLNPRVGQEMDRFQKLLASVKDLKSPGPTVGGGVIAAALAKLAEAGGNQGAPEEENDDEDPAEGYFEDDEEEDDDFEDAEILA